VVRTSHKAREVLRQTGELWRDYTKIRLLGDGTYSKVWLVSSKHTGEQFAAKEVTLLPSSTSRTGHGAGRRREGRPGGVSVDSLGEEVAAQGVIDAVRAGAGDLLEDIALFDVYTGPQIGDGRKSLTLALRFRATDRTLTEDEASAARDAAVAAAADRFGAVLRG
jgi:serine/threonine protein kinase